MNAPIRRWPESDIDTLTSMPTVQHHTPPAPVKRRIMEQDPVVARPPTREEVEAIEDQILRMAFGKAMKTVRIRTILTVFLAGLLIGFVGLGLLLAILVTKAGAS
jgi:hypothetical protein